MKNILKKIRDKLLSGVYARLNSMREEFSGDFSFLKAGIEKLEKLSADNRERTAALSKKLTDGSINNNAAIDALKNTFFTYSGEYLLPALFLSSTGLPIYGGGSNFKKVYGDFIASFDSDKELSFFNDVPLEAFGKHLEEAVDIFAAGQLAWVLTEYLKKGRAVRPYTGGAAKKLGSAEFCPVSIIPFIMESAEVFVSTNPYLSSVLVNTENLAEEICGRVSEYCVLPFVIEVPLLQAEWRNGFAPLEKHPDTGKYYHWAVGFDGASSIFIKNNGMETVKCNVCFEIIFLRGGDKVTAEIYGHKTEVCHESGNLKGSLRVELHPGDNEIIFGHTGIKEKIGADHRELKFGITGLHIDTPEGKSLAGIEDAYEKGPDYQRRQDLFIRERLHSSGFFSIEAYIVANKGFYSYKLPSSSFSIHKGEILSQGDTAAIINEYASACGKSRVYVVYKCFRKCVPGGIG